MFEDPHSPLVSSRTSWWKACLSLGCPKSSPNPPQLHLRSAQSRCFHPLHKQSWKCWCRWKCSHREGWSLWPRCLLQKHSSSGAVSCPKCAQSCLGQYLPESGHGQWCSHWRRIGFLRVFPWVKSKLGSLYSVFTPFSNNICSSQLSLFCLAIVSIVDWMMWRWFCLSHLCDILIGQGDIVKVVIVFELS